MFKKTNEIDLIIKENIRKFISRAKGSILKGIQKYEEMEKSEMLQRLERGGLLFSNQDSGGNRDNFCGAIFEEMVSECSSSDFFKL